MKRDKKNGNYLREISLIYIHALNGHPKVSCKGDFVQALGERHLYTFKHLSNNDIVNGFPRGIRMVNFLPTMDLSNSITDFEVIRISQSDNMYLNAFKSLFFEDLKAQITSSLCMFSGFDNFFAFIILYSS